MANNPKKIRKVYKYMSQFPESSNKLEKALEKMEWRMELFFISLTNEIINELQKINKNDQDPKQTEKNNNINIQKTNTFFLYKMINIFEEIKKYKDKISNDIIEYIISAENITKILGILKDINGIVNTDQNIIKERNNFNNNIINLLTNFINLNNKFSAETQFDVFNEFFVLFSKREENRDLLYELEKNIIFVDYPDNNNLKELINYTIDCLYEELNKNCCIRIISEIKKILFLYKNEIKIISKKMMNLIIKIFSLYENEIGNHFFINDFLKFCFNEISFE